MITQQKVNIVSLDNVRVQQTDYGKWEEDGEEMMGALVSYGAASQEMLSKYMEQK